jgi:hypothetical protein
MKKLFFVIFVFLLVVPAFAQANPADAGFTKVEAKYVVQRGDTLWGLSKAYQQNGDAWRTLITKNPWINDRIEDLGDGEARVLIYPGEIIKGLTRAQVEGAEPIVVGLHVPLDFGVSTTLFKKGDTLPIERQKTDLYATGSAEALLFGLFVILAMVLAAFTYLVYLAMQSRKDPVSSGEPLVRGGINSGPTEWSQVTEHFNGVAVRRQEQLGWNGYGNPGPERIGDIESGFLNGFGRVRYANGNEEPRQMRDTPAYRSRFRFTRPDGTRHEEDLFFLQGCANDVRMGTRYLDFAFTREREVQAPPPQPETIQRPHEVVAIGNVGADGTTTLVVGDREMQFTAGSRITVRDKGVVDVRFGDGMSLSIIPSKAKKTKTKVEQVSPAATAT